MISESVRCFRSSIRMSLFATCWSVWPSLVQAPNSIRTVSIHQKLHKQSISPSLRLVSTAQWNNNTKFSKTFKNNKYTSELSVFSSVHLWSWPCLKSLIRQLIAVLQWHTWPGGYCGQVMNGVSKRLSLELGVAGGSVDLWSLRLFATSFSATAHENWTPNGCFLCRILRTLRQVKTRSPFNQVLD